MTRPVVALATATETIDGVPYAAVRQAYIDALEKVADCDVVLLPGSEHPCLGLIERFDGLVLGGHESNVEPGRYLGSPCDGPFDTARDALALSVAPRAVAAGLPVFGICRGLQELNVAYGGTLRALGSDAHREDLALPRDEQYLPVHEVAVAADGTLRRFLGWNACPRVNSLHGQVVDRLAPLLRAEAVAEDGVIEAVSVVGARTFSIAVQWHPEWYAESDPVSRRLFSAFGMAAATRATDRTVKASS